MEQLVPGVAAAQALDDDHRLLERAGGEQHGELVAAVAGEEVLGANVRAPGAGAVLQQRVAREMAELVVHRLEPVEVDQGDGKRRAVAPCARHLARELLVPAAPVRQQRQRVGRRQLREPRREPRERTTSLSTV